MKANLLVLLGLCSVTGLFAQADAAAANRKNRSVTPNQILEKTPPDTTGFHGREIIDVTYGRNVTWKGATVELKLDVYIPDAAKEKKLPLFVWIHGGAYSVGDKKGAKTLCQAIAAKGFVVATINYRMGWQDNEQKTANDPQQMGRAAYRALQDSHAALRFLAAHAQDYQFDPNWIFVGGASAGAGLSLNLAYATEQLAEASQPGITTLLGPITSVTNDLTTTFKLRGIVDFWGAMVSVEAITADNAVPTLFLHGMKDGTAPYDVGQTFSLKNYPTIYGSWPIYQRLQKLGVSSQAYFDPTGGHGVFPTQFRVDKAADFMLSVMHGEKRTGVFVGDGADFKSLAAGEHP